MTLNGQKQLRPSLRILAAACLVGWLVAMGVCSAHCSLGFLTTKSPGKRPCCQHEGGKQESGNSSCLIKKSALTTVTAHLQFKPELRPLHVPITSEPVQEAVLTQTLISPFRQGLPTDRPATPEVYLGAATFSLAPPFRS
ncbi:hypothetical protein [Pedosphaera parvula]|uniref:Uncharacterized protein n=1 Tax=Pedosphaera parvula (strain Ellin514) TaxID=320771 RepID=B9XQN7_PEDPL|nr:hypothetical protein [Pedosphaera parvula]EEF57819.1 hypothetical protein Cflav_PD0801 [Pedosphaera parvula Ellin514]